MRIVEKSYKLSINHNTQFVNNNNYRYHISMKKNEKTVFAGIVES